MSALEVRIRLPLGEGAGLDVAFDAPARGVIGLFGPSGAGKTMVLRCLAGLERNAHGRIRVGDEVWHDTRSRTFLPPHRRAVGYVFQEPGLFPHLTVRGNLRYAYDRAPTRRIAWDEAIAWLGLEPLLDRTTGALSGGERQRVAIARALLASPRLLLMDEPLSALDETGRGEILPYLEMLPARLRVPILYVSHSLAEVVRLADRLVWLVAGRVRAAGAPADVLARADFARWRGPEAAVVVDAVVREHDDAYGLTRFDAPWGPLWLPRQRHAPGRRVRVEVRAADVSIGLAADAASSILNQFAARIVAIEEVGAGEVVVRLVCGDGGGEGVGDDGGSGGGEGDGGGGQGGEGSVGVRDDGEPDDGGGEDGGAGGRESRAGMPLLARIPRRACDRLGLAPGMRVCARVGAAAVVG